MLPQAKQKNNSHNNWIAFVRGQWKYLKFKIIFIKWPKSKEIWMLLLFLLLWKCSIFCSMFIVRTSDNYRIIFILFFIFKSKKWKWWELCHRNAKRYHETVCAWTVMSLLCRRNTKQIFVRPIRCREITLSSKETWWKHKQPLVQSVLRN